MKRLLLSSILALVAIRTFATPTKHALIIAIGNYPDAGGWPQLSSLTDADSMRAMLLNDSFQDENIKILKDADATVEGISNAFKQLIASVKPGDVVVIHFSCHGEQVLSLNPGKLSGYDQCVVTYNALAPAKSKNFDKDTANYYRGQTIGIYLQQLRARLGRAGDVVIFMDYCCSGAGTRGVGRKRGGEPPFLPPGYSPDKGAKQNKSDVYTVGATPILNEDKLATFVAISATKPEETDQEVDYYNGMGSLTYAVCKSFQHLDPGTTYRTLFAKIQAQMNYDVPGQHPLIEGNGLDRTLFGGNFVFQKPYIEIQELRDDNQIIVKAGTLAGLDTGATVKVYRSGTTDPSGVTPLATGKVIDASSFTSTVQLDSALSISQRADGWVFVTEPVYKLEKINVEIVSNKVVSGDATLNFSKSDIDNIRKGLKDLPVVGFTGSPNVWIIKGPTVDSMLNAKDGSLIDTFKGIARLRALLTNYAQYQFLKGVEVDDHYSEVDVKLIPVINGVPDTSKMNDSLYEYHNGDKMVVWVKNKSDHEVYINILDMQPNGIINPIFPYMAKHVYPWDLKIPAGQARILDNKITIYPPYGTEVFKVFASNNMIDMEGIANNGTARMRNGATRGNLTALEKLVKNSEGVGSRGAGVERGEAADGSSYNVLFRIVP